MNVLLADRQKVHVIEFYHRTQDKEIRNLFPFTNNSLEESLLLFQESLKVDAKSFGKIILVDNKYIGDIWCYGIDEIDEKMAMLSVVIFDKNYWDKGIAAIAIKKFIDIIFQKYNISKIGAFTYSHNIASIKVLEKSSFTLIEIFIEGKLESKYYEYEK